MPQIRGICGHLYNELDTDFVCPSCQTCLREVPCEICASWTEAFRWQVSAQQPFKERSPVVGKAKSKSVSKPRSLPAPMPSASLDAPDSSKSPGGGSPSLSQFIVSPGLELGPVRGGIRSSINLGVSSDPLVAGLELTVGNTQVSVAGHKRSRWSLDRSDQTWRP